MNAQELFCKRALEVFEAKERVGLDVDSIKSYCGMVSAIRSGPDPVDFFYAALTVKDGADKSTFSGPGSRVMCVDGQWIGWPLSEVWGMGQFVSFLNSIVLLDCKESQELVTTRVFTKKENT